MSYLHLQRDCSALARTVAAAAEADRHPEVFMLIGVCPSAQPLLSKAPNHLIEVTFHSTRVAIVVVSLPELLPVNGL